MSAAADRWRRAARQAGRVVTIGLLMGRPLAGQSPPVEEQTLSTPPHESFDQRERHGPRLYVGMWTTHLKSDIVVLKNNWVAGLSARGYFGATFVNSFGKRAFTGGWQRPITAVNRRQAGLLLGYRLGFVTGYDGRLMRIARKTPVLPLAQPFVSLDISHIGVEVSYTFVVVSVAASYRF